MTPPKPRRQDVLPRSLPPIGLSREVAAAYIDLSPAKFDELVRDGRMPRPKQIDGRRVWSRVAIEKAFYALPGGDDCEERNPQDDVLDTTLADSNRLERHSSSTLREIIEDQYADAIRHPLGKAEMRLLAALFEARPGAVSVRSLKGVGLSALGKLQARGFVMGDSGLEYHEDRISPAGIEAYQSAISRHL